MTAAAAAAALARLRPARRHLSARVACKHVSANKHRSVCENAKLGGPGQSWSSCQRRSGVTHWRSEVEQKNMKIGKMFSPDGYGPWTFDGVRWSLMASPMKLQT